MPPFVALLLCTGFVLFLLRLERRLSRRVSSALWIPTLWMLAIATKPLALWFGVSGDNESGSWLDRLFLTSLSVAGIMVLARRRFDCLSAFRRHRWLLALLAYTFISTLWSDITIIALKRWMREVIVIIMALVIISEADPREALESLLRRLTYILIPFSLALIKYYPSLGVAFGRWSGIRMWVGVALQKNSLGRVCMIGSFFLLWALYRGWREPAMAGGRYNRWADLSILLISLFLLAGAKDAYSATAVGAFAVGITTFLGLLCFQKLKLRLPRPALLALVIFLIGFGTSTPFVGGSNVATFTSSLGRDDTLTGRTEVWAALVPVVEREPLFGAGFESFWTTERRELYDIPHGHNGYLDALLELGAVGLTLNTAWLLSCARKLHAALAEDFYRASLAICFLLMALICNFTESVLSSFTEQITAVIALASLVMADKPNRVKDANASGEEAATSIGRVGHDREKWPEFTGKSTWT
jgi:exopolysaccharide production protein ExoQ